MKRLLQYFTLLLLLTACSSIDCQLNSLVYTQYQLMDEAGKVDTLYDTLTVYTNRVDGNDAVLINRNINTTEFALPISYGQPEDVFHLVMTDTTGVTRYDEITVVKENTMHFESIDCAPSYFHKITDVRHTTNNIDSIKIINPDVTYDTSKKHFHIYFKNRD